MKSCLCGKEINAEATTNYVFWEEDYCSTYCRLFDERGLEKVNRGESLKEKGNPNWKNFTGFFDYPEIKSECVCCGKEVILSKTAEPSKPYCSRACHTKIHRHPKSRKSQFVFTMLRVMKHYTKKRSGGDEWICSSRMYSIMQRMGCHPEKNPYAMLMRIWASRGVLDTKDSSHHSERGTKLSIKEYRFKPSLLEMPLGKVFYEYAGVTFD
jgi:hypothetical protein